MEKDSGVDVEYIRVDGGAVSNEFLMQFQSDMLNLPVELAKLNETTALGAAFLAGLATGFWKDEQELTNLRESQKQYEPKMETKRKK